MAKMSTPLTQWEKLSPHSSFFLVTVIVRRPIRFSEESSSAPSFSRVTVTVYSG